VEDVQLEESLFHEELEILERGSRLLESDHSGIDWKDEYTDLLKQYKRLYVQTRRLVKMSDSTQNELSRARESAQFQASHDFLTLLWNRRAIIGILNGELNRGVREGKPLTVLIADVDHFKRINDNYGHLAGDRVLQEISRRLQSGTRSYDHLGRFGGEEFIVVAPSCCLNDGINLAERLRNAVAEKIIDTPEGRFNITISVGVCTVENDDYLHSIAPDTIIRTADGALYAAKESGRNRVHAAGINRHSENVEEN
jgi:diguanylate cyclase (GGDEF)-like protein